MNPVEIEQAVSDLAAEPFDAAEFPFKFLEAFGNKLATIEKLRAGISNKSDVPGGVLQRSNIHIAVCGAGAVTQTLTALRESPATAKAKAKFILTTDGADFEAEDLVSGDVIACAYADFPDYFGFFLPLAGITIDKQITDNPIDIKAVGRLNRLYVELLKTNPEWEQRQHDMNHFMARLIFCFFAEDTDIFNGDNLFTDTVNQFSAPDSSNTHEVIGELFRAMNTPIDTGREAKLKSWADVFPYVNGELFSGNMDVPRFSKIARSYLIRAGELNWTEINPDIFGSMIQSVTDKDERGASGLHYTSVPNILKVLNPLFLDDLRAQLAAAGDNKRKLLNLRNRMAHIRVFDPACGSGNFLVIAYKEMREIEAEINKRRDELERRSDIPPTNFRGIEIRDFPAEIARLALIIAEFQCDVLYRGQKEALAEFLPLSNKNWITCGNALQLDWLNVCRPTGIDVKMASDNLLETPLDQAEVNFENLGGETYICGNPPYLGSKWQSKEQKFDLESIFKNKVKKWKSLDYVAGWFMKAAEYSTQTNAASAFVSTNSICQGEQVSILWPLISNTGHQISFAYTPFKWSNLASHNAGVIVVIIGMSNAVVKEKILFHPEGDESIVEKRVDNINAYLINGPDIFVAPITKSKNECANMQFGNHPYYGSALIFSAEQAREIISVEPLVLHYIRPLYGSEEFIKNLPRACLWIEDDAAEQAMSLPSVATRTALVKIARKSAKKDKTAQKLAETPYRFRDQLVAEKHAIIVPRVSSEERKYLPAGVLASGTIISDRNFAFYDAPLWNMALVVSRLHWVWIATVCMRLGMSFSYSNTLGWNTFPLPSLTENQKTELTRCAEDILLAREAHFPATIADLYKPDAMPEDLRRAHDRNDETLERIYIGRRFKNDTERLEKLFEMYAKMTAEKNAAKPESQA